MPSDAWFFAPADANVFAAPEGAGSGLDGGLQLSSVKKKRRMKMNKHKRKKRRKLNRLKKRFK